MKTSTKFAIGMGLVVIAGGTLALAANAVDSRKPQLPPDNEASNENPDSTEDTSILENKADNQENKSPPIDEERRILERKLEYINAALAGVSTQLPGVKESVQVMADWIERDPAAVAQVVARFRSTSERFGAAASQAASAAAARFAQAKGILDGLQTADTAMQVVSKIPLIGQIVAGIYQVARPFVAAAADAKAAGNDLFAANWSPAGKQLFTGWIGDGSGNPGSGDYYIQDVPILSFGSPIMVVPFLEYSIEYLPIMNAFVRLTISRPLAIDAMQVTIDADGYYYAFNANGNNDLSAEAVSRQEVYAMTVWNPADISRTGPRGFDRKNPRGWLEAARAEALQQGWIDPSRSPYVRT